MKLSDLKNIAQDALILAKKLGATQAEVGIVNDNGFNTTIRLGTLETMEYHCSDTLALTVYFGKRKAVSVTSNINKDSVQSAVEKACNIARFTEEDSCAGLADKNLMAKDLKDLDLYHEWQMTPEQASELAIQCEDKARAADARITNSEGVSISTFKTFSVYANSHGFVGEIPSTTHNITCVLIAEEKGNMERDYYYSIARDPKELESIDQIAQKASESTVNRLNARKIKTQKVPVIFHAEMARELLGNFMAAISGSSLYRKTSFLVDHLNKPVFAKHIGINEKPHLPKLLGSAMYDSEGVATMDKFFIKDGILTNYVLNSYSGRKLKLPTTGNANGVHNLFINTSDLDFKALLKKMDKGILVTELIGQGVNLVTGDYSRGAVGFWVEKGEIQYPISEITIAGNLKEMFLNLVAVANDIDKRGNIQTGSILLEEMMAAGN